MRLDKVFIESLGREHIKAKIAREYFCNGGLYKRIVRTLFLNVQEKFCVALMISTDDLEFLCFEVCVVFQSLDLPSSELERIGSRFDLFIRGLIMENVAQRLGSFYIVIRYVFEFGNLFSQFSRFKPAFQ